MNLAFADFEKMANNKLSHIGFEALEMFREANKGELPRPWNLADAQDFVEKAKKIAERYGEKPAEWK